MKMADSSVLTLENSARFFVVLLFPPLGQLKWIFGISMSGQGIPASINENVKEAICVF